jgi:hypothetical protein
LLEEAVMIESQRRSVAPGVILSILGAAIILVVLAADAGGAPILERLAFMLGLAFAPFAAGIGLSLLLIGLWLVWRARQPPA